MRDPDVRQATLASMVDLFIECGSPRPLLPDPRAKAGLELQVAGSHLRSHSEPSSPTHCAPSERCTASTSPWAASCKQWAAVGPRLNTGAVKQTPAKRVEQLFTRLVELLDTEWKSIRSLNLGIQSGTGVVDELVMRKLQQWVQQLHTICVTSNESAHVLARLAKQLSLQQLQQLQVMFDVTEHHYLADFMRLAVFNTSKPFATTAVGQVARRPWQRSRKGRMHVAQDTTNQQDKRNDRVLRANRLKLRDHDFIRFAEYLSEGHPLVQTAYGLYHDRQLQASRQKQHASPQLEGPEEPSANTFEADSSYVSAGPFHSRAGRRQAHTALVPMWVSIEDQWRGMVHDDLLGKDTMPSSIVISSPMPVYTSYPDWKQRQLERESELAMQASLHHVYSSQLGSRLSTPKPSTPTPLAKGSHPVKPW